MLLPAPTPRLRGFGLSVLLAGQLLPMIDFSIVNVALDAISHSLQATETQLEMIVAGYGVAFAVCLAMGGRLGDNFGRRRLFMIGVLLFGITSLSCGMATSVWQLLAARVAQGASAALIVPQVLATIHVTLEGRHHSRALGLFGAIGGLAFIIGQVLGGLLITLDPAGQGWRTVFLINLPVCAGILVVLRAFVPETRRADAQGIDVPGTLLLALVITFLLVPLALGPSLHWSWPCILLLAAVPPLLLVLRHVEMRQERQGRAPLLLPSLMRLPSVRFGLLIAVLFFSCWSGFMFAMALTLQAGAGLSPLASGNAFIVLGVAYSAGALLTPRMVGRFGLTPTLLIGCAIQMSALFGLMATVALAWPQLTALNLAAPTLFLGVGQAFIVSCFFRIGLSDVPAEHAGAGSAVLTTVQQASFGLGSALLGGVFGHVLGLGHTGYRQAALATLAFEWGLMLILLGATLVYMRRKTPATRCVPVSQEG